MQRDLLATQRPLGHWISFAAQEVEFALQSESLDTQVPFSHRILKSIVHLLSKIVLLLASVQSSFLSTQEPVNGHLTGFEFGQPLSTGQSVRLEAQAPIWHRTGLTAGHVLLFVGHKAALALQLPSPHLTLPEAHGDKGRQRSGDGTQRPSAHGIILPAGSPIHWLMSKPVK